MVRYLVVTSTQSFNVPTPSASRGADLITHTTTAVIIRTKVRRTVFFSFGHFVLVLHTTFYGTTLVESAVLATTD